MTKYDLATDDGLRAALTSLGPPSQWGDKAPDRIRRLAETFDWVRSSSEEERASRQFQERLWEHNHVAAIGQRARRSQRPG